MLVKKVDLVVKPRTMKKVKETVSAQKPKTNQTINSYEFHLGFIPTRRGGTTDPNKVEHFIDQIV